MDGSRCGLRCLGILIPKSRAPRLNSDLRATTDKRTGGPRLMEGPVTVWSARVAPFSSNHKNWRVKSPRITRVRSACCGANVDWRVSVRQTSTPEDACDVDIDCDVYLTPTAERLLILVQISCRHMGLLGADAGEVEKPLDDLASSPTLSPNVPRVTAVFSDHLHSCCLEPPWHLAHEAV